MSTQNPSVEHLAEQDRQIVENYINNQKREARQQAFREIVELMCEMHKEANGKHNYYLHAMQKVKERKNAIKSSRYKLAFKAKLRQL